jgi:CYTH domain-containing protein
LKPKYAIDEIERRWLVAAEDAAPHLHDAPLRILDKYIDGCRLRLRKIATADGEFVYKFCKSDISEARNFAPPEFVGEEVTDREAYSGFSLARRMSA